MASIILPPEIKDYLNEVSKELPKSVMPHLSKGDLVQKSWGLNYLIDNTEIFKKLGDFPEGKIPYKLIYEALEPSQTKILEVFGGEKQVEFSKAFEAGAGQCLEKAVLVQLSAQVKRDAFLINGALGLENEVGVGPHAFNVVIKDEKPYLIDAENPIFCKDSEGGVQMYPYIAPIDGISNGDFMLPQGWQYGRFYSIT